ncbi:MAG: hypothetical protein R6U88_02315 [Candidatus Bipolaricaulota bacterium]
MRKMMREGYQKELSALRQATVDMGRAAAGRLSTALELMHDPDPHRVHMLRGETNHI